MQAAARPRPQLTLTTVLFAAILLLAGCATNPVTGKQDLVLMSEAQELTLGQQAHQQTLQQYRVYNDAALQQYVDAVGQRLAEKSHRTGLSYTFTVLDSTEINAFALPGGYIYMTRGLLAYMNSEAELAAVLGHELGHVTARHGVRQASSAQAASIGTGLLSLFVPQLGSSGLDQTLGMLSTAVLRGYGREHELEADRLGATYIAATGYDPKAMFDVIKTLKNHELLDQKLAALEGREARAYHGVFATHPDNDTRLQEAIAYSPTTASAGGERQRQRFLKQIDGLIFGENPAEGVFQNGRFVHADLNVTFALPATWRGQNSSSQLILAEPTDKAFVVVQLAKADGNATPSSILQKFGIATLSKAEAIKPSGYDGVSGLATIAVGGAKRPARVAALIAGRYAYIFIGVTKDPSHLGAFDEQFRAVPLSFRPPTASEKAAIRPNVVRVTKLSGPITWAGLAQASPIKKLPEDQLRLLNAADGTGADAGSQIKIIE